MARNEKLTELEILEREMRQTVKLANTAVKSVSEFKKIHNSQVKYINELSSQLMKEKNKFLYAMIAAVSGWAIIGVFTFFWLIGE